MGLRQNRIVVKVGTSTLTNELGQSDLRSFDNLARVVSDVHNMGYEVILVSSGAIAIGSNRLKMKTRPTSHAPEAGGGRRRPVQHHVPLRQVFPRL
jgi:glutamate 5-kinase